MPQLSCGGVGEVKPCDETVRGVVDKVKGSLFDKVKSAGSRPHLNNVEAHQFDPTPVHYKTQVVAGTNFFVKVKIGEGDFVHARIYRDLQGNVTLHSLQDPKGEEDDLAYF